MERTRTVSVEETAELLQKSLQFVRVGLQRGLLPFGVAIQTRTEEEHGRDRWSYCIYRKKLEEYIGEIIYEDFEEVSNND